MGEQLQEIKVRRMTPEDIPAVTALEERCFSMPWTEKGFAEGLAQEQNIFVVAQMPDGRIAGYCGLYVSFDEADITNIAVDEACRKQGIGYAIWSTIREYALEAGVKSIFLEVRMSNVAAQTLYRKAGFESCGVRKGFYQKPTEDALVMCAQLAGE